ncbi:unnamed protein product [Rotaria sordida]|uniref:C2 domain-containing protein n=1 Tax=Rotaria sordida TaxID=392033 RepID=A0A815V1T7_9BILA|nr:unnamed protein product [Rotaria sordida]CAF1526411.1 unnamed protein product [Rotaria sordida]
MALTVFLFKVAKLEIGNTKSDVFDENQEQSTPLINDDNTQLLCAKVIFRESHLWSNNVPIYNGTASFIARGNKPKKFEFNLATMLLPNDKMRIEFYTTTMKNKRKKMIALFELMLQSLIDSKYIDLPEENLSDPNNYLLKSTIQLKLYYTSPNIEREKVALSQVNDLTNTIDWKSTFDDEGRQNGHRHRYTHKKHRKGLKKLRMKLVGRANDTDSDSYSDVDLDDNKNPHETFASMTEEEKLKVQYNNLELLEKSLGRYEGDAYQMTQWQIMVNIIQGRDFPGHDINPYVCAQIADQKRYTGMQKCTNSPFFGEFFTFDFSLSATQMMQTVIYFKVHHAQKLISTFIDTKPIGIFKVDVATVYNEKEHVFERKWAQLTHPDSIKAPCGYLLVSVAIAQRGVSTKNILGETTQDDDELKPSKEFIPAAMPRHLFPVQLKITFFTATELPEMMTDFLATVSKKILASDDWEPVDPYVEVSYNAIKATTDYRNGTSPVWGEALYLIGQFPPLVRTIKIALKDHAAVQKDRTIASFLIDLFSISESNPLAGFLPIFGPTWVFLYGSPREYTINKDQDDLGERIGEGICYKGRLLMEIECHPISGEHTSNMNVQKESGIQFPDVHIFPMKRTFILFGGIFDVTMIDKAFGNTAICFELSMGSSGYLNPQQLTTHQSVSSVTRPYPRSPIDNNAQHFRLPIDLQKPILFTKYIFHDYRYRMNLSNRLKHASEHMLKLIREFESNVNSKVSNDILLQQYRKMEEYIHTLPCGCSQMKSTDNNLDIMGLVHATLSETLNFPKTNLRMNILDEKRRKKILHNLESLKIWISKEVDFDESKLYETVKELYKIARALRQLAIDAQPSLPDIFLWMICDSKRVAYARIPPEDILFSLCEGDKGLHNGRIQTLFLQTPRTTDKPIKSSTNAKIQIYLWLGTEEQEINIFKQLPAGFDMPPLPLPVDIKYIRYNKRSFYELRCHCYKARSLIASDETGFSDPYLSITAGNETQTTPILKESLCPQWNITLVFRNLIHVGNRETAEETIGNVVVECYDYDDTSDGPDLIGRFSTTATLDLFNNKNPYNKQLFQWYEFKFGDKRAGELLAVFELNEIDPESRQTKSIFNLDEIEITAENFPPNIYITKFMKNKIYEIPHIIMPDLKPYEIEVMFWGLRECRPINFQSIQQAEVSIECAGARITKIIKDVQKNPNFESALTDTDKYKIIVNLPKDNSFWPHLSISCVQHRLFGMKEPVGNLVVTDLQKYLEKPRVPLTSNDEALAEAVNELSKRLPYDFNRVRRSVIDAYEAVLASQDKEVGQRKLTIFESETCQTESLNGSQITIINADSLALEHENENNDISENTTKTSNNSSIQSKSTIDNYRDLTAADKLKRNQMEKVATWWNKYYASKAKLRLEKKPIIDLDEGLEDSYNVYAEFFEDEPIGVKQRWAFWNKAKKAIMRAGKARKELKNLAFHGIEHLTDYTKIKKSAIDESLDIIENDRLKELTLLQTFDIIDTELENVHDYEGFNDCLDLFPLYKGKGTSRSDEKGDESRVYAKFKGKLRIREITSNGPHRITLANINKIPRMSIHPVLLKEAYVESKKNRKTDSGIRTDQQMLQFDFNQHPITLKCRLYIIKALLYRARDASGKADPYIKILLGNEVIIDDVNGRLCNTLEPVFGRSYEFEVTIPQQSLLHIQLWDWDLTSLNDKIGETSIDIENRWFSCHRATCALQNRYDSAGYNAWRDTKKPTIILNELCRTTNINLPIYTSDFRSLTIDKIRFDCDSECIESVSKGIANDMSHRKVHHESPEEYIRQNTALAALHGWGRKINPKGALVSEHIECRSIFDPKIPDVEQGKLEMWLDIFPMSRPPSSAPVDITPLKPIPYQLRLTIWNTTDIELNDENFITGEKTSDIYVKAWILGEKDDGQQTDVHYRSLTGEGNFNWRFIFDFNYIDIEEKIVHEKKDSVFQIGNSVKKLPPRIVIRVYDADLFAADDFLGECILLMTHLPIGSKSSNNCKADILLDPKHRSLNLFVNKRIAGWWPLIAPSKVGEIRDTILLGGKVEAEFTLLTAEEAEKNPVGEGREGPQPLEEPNRPKTSFQWFTSPWKTFRYVVWRNFKWSIIIGIIIFIFVVCLLLALWSLPGELVGQLTSKVFKTNTGKK